MRQIVSLRHTRGECNYHVVFIPKYRRRSIFGHIRRELGEVFDRSAEHKERQVEEGHLMPDYMHVMVSIKPKYSVSQVGAYIKGKSAIHIVRRYMDRRRNYGGQHFWARGYFVSTVGRNEEAIPEYIGIRRGKIAGMTN